MQLIEQTRGKRIYRSNAGDLHEVRAEMRGQQAMLSCKPNGELPLSDEALQLALGMLKEALGDWFKAKRKLGFEPFGEVESGLVPDVTVTEVEDEETGEPTGELIYHRMIYAERGYWPPAPAEPNPELEELTPRPSDFKGDRFSEKWRGRFV